MPLTPDLLFAILLGVFALAALSLALARSNTPRSRNGWLILALAAILQVGNLALGYHWLLSVVTTAVLLWGAWLLSRARGRA